ncbi:MAG: 4Fe-4S dicluster domain-containing protein [Deltaproteobacteria bacterium]|nr:4Fe-4S dicluster domain-containing protein [Deltaproteobacteria bacterium]
MKRKHLIYIRRSIQALFLILFIILLIQTRLPQDVYIDYSIALGSEQDIRIDSPVTLFFKADPLIWLTSVIAGHQWIAGFGLALLVVIITMLFGRAFCGFICPFGTIHNMVGMTKPALKGKRRIDGNEKSSIQKVKYFILFTIIIAALFGLNVAGIMDPFSFLFRSLALGVFPGIGIGLKELFDIMARSDIKILNLSSYAAEVFVSPVFGYGYKSFQTGWLIGTLFLFILFLNRIRPRFWCRVLCPLGAMLGIVSKFSIMKLEKDTEKCTDCKLCVKHCQGAASPIPGKQWESAECLSCFNCFNICPEDVISFKFRLSPTTNPLPDVGRRAILGSVVAGISLPFLGRLDGQIHKIPNPLLIRPPGSVREKDFLALCQRCGLCMKVCPTNAINPALTEGGMAGFWTPNLIMIHGYCEYSCTLCSSICPTGAIKEISLKEKIQQPIKIGSAYLDRGRCLPWSGNSPCIVCEEVCPTSPKSIHLVKTEVPGPDGKKMKVQLPYVDLKKCVGCGICENKCPVKGKPAIRIISAGETRSKKNQILLGF